MAKNVKLNTKKKFEADGRFYINGGFFHRYKVTRVTNVVLMVLQVISLAATAVFALCLGVLGSLSMMAEGNDWAITTISGYIQTALVLWLVSSVVYVIGTLVLFLGFSRIAAGIHTAALVMSLVMYYLFRLAGTTANIDTAGPAALYMPCVFIAVITIAITLIVNIPLWLDEKAEKDAEVAPSILAEDKEE
ncbi:MAG: hypothetical protein IJZ47_06455 [Oscillospiraceae bacterium]|nr:hypothetical protein [Oscillospiraceae bacterium]